MIDLIAEMAIAESYRDMGAATEKLPDSIRHNIGEAVLARHGYTYEQMDSSLNWYGKNLDQFYELYAKADKEITKRQKKIAKATGNTELENKEENLWPYADHFLISPLGNSDGLNFSINAKSLLKGENLVWKMRLNRTGNFKAFLGVEYADGSVSYSNSSNFGERKIKVELITDTTRKPIRIIGILQADKSALPVWVDSIQINKMPFDSTLYSRRNSQRNYSR